MQEKKESIARKFFWVVLVLPVLMFISFLNHSLYLLDFTHVFSGALWTGADIFLGFFIGPIMKRLDPEQRKGLIGNLIPKTILYLPVLAFTTGTAGWVLANRIGDLSSTNPERYWIYAALIIITILSIQGFVILLPTQIRTYRELQKENPNFPKILRFSRLVNRLSGIQGIFQVAIILVMAHLAT